MRAPHPGFAVMTMLFSTLPFELSAIAVALMGALAYGSGDFMGGRAAVRLSPSGAVALAQTAAMVVAAQVFVAGAGNFAANAVLLPGLIGGMAYALGLLFLYQGIALGRIGVVAPVCGIVGILVPMLGDFALSRHISATQFQGIGICALAIVLLAGTPERPAIGADRWFSLRTGFLSGMGYGTADLCLGMMAPEDGAATLLVARAVAASIAVALLLRAFALAGGFGPATASATAGAAAVKRRPPVALAWLKPPRLMIMLPAAALAVVAGILDAIGHMSYVHVATQGSMAVASALVALFPAVVVVLAVVILRERILGLQYLGLAASVGGVAMLSL